VELTATSFINLTKGDAASSAEPRPRLMAYWLCGTTTVVVLTVVLPAASRHVSVSV
jgi:hypothetical protein